VNEYGSAMRVCVDNTCEDKRRKVVDCCLPFYMLNINPS
jgi:hypothetical protein